MNGPVEEGFNSYTAGKPSDIAAKTAEAAVSSTLAADEINLALESLKQGPGRYYVLSGEVADRAPQAAIQRGREEIKNPEALAKFERDVKDGAFRMATGAAVSNGAAQEAAPELDILKEASAFGEMKPPYLGALISDGRKSAEATASPVAIPLEDRASFYERMLDPEASKNEKTKIGQTLENVEFTLKALIGAERRAQAFERQIGAPQGKLLAA